MAHVTGLELRASLKQSVHSSYALTHKPSLKRSAVGSTDTLVQSPLATENDDGVRLRLGERQDALCLSVLAMQVFLDTYATDGIRPAIAREALSGYSQGVFDAALADPQSRFCIAERSGHLIGFAHVVLGATHELAPTGRQAELLRLYVQEPFTGKRVGTQLLARAEDLACEGGATVVWLTPWVHNHRALGFYLARGYQDFGLTHFDFEGESHENRVHAKTLRAASSA